LQQTTRAHELLITTDQPMTGRCGVTTSYLYFDGQTHRIWRRIFPKVLRRTQMLLHRPWTNTETVIRSSEQTAL